MPIDVSGPSGPSLAARAPVLPTAAPAILAALLAFGCATPEEKGPGGQDIQHLDLDRADPSDPTGPDADGPGDTDGGEDTAGPGDTDPGDTASDPDDTGTGGGDTGPGDPAEGWTCDAWADPVSTGNVSDSSLGEISGIAPSRANPGLLWVLEDSGGESVVYALDATGALVGTLTVAGVSNRDWEGLAVAPCPDGEGDCVWVGDTGDNGLSRSDVAVHVVREPVVRGEFELSAEPTTYRYSFPDGRGNVEGFAIGADGLPVLVTKRVDATADVYRFPSLEAGGSVTLEHIARISTGDPSDEHPAEATGADISPDGSRLLVRTYGFVHEYPLVDGVPGEGVSLPAPDEPQGEAIAYDGARHGVWITSEGSRQPLWFVACAD